eukprot:4239723-Pleurochrysis_carterae.AAC.1
MRVCRVFIGVRVRACVPLRFWIACWRWSARRPGSGASGRVEGRRWQCASGVTRGDDPGQQE